MANGTTVKECEFKKECEKTGSRCPYVGVAINSCGTRKFGMLVRNATIKDVVAISEETIKHLQWKMYQQRRERLEALIMEVE